MRHRKNTAKLGMKSQHKRATLANLVCSLIKYKRITTTVARAKAARRLADKMVTLGKAGTLTARRLAASRLSLRGPGPDMDKEARARWHKSEDILRILFDEIAPSFKDRQGGYTRVVRVGSRRGDAAELAILEWTSTVVGPVEPEKKGKKAKGEKKEDKKS
jgi:large subunit ribosomal protein L17